MPSHAVLRRLNAIVVPLAGILGALLVVVLADRGPGELVVAVAVSTAIARLAVERVDDGTGRGS